MSGPNESPLNVRKLLDTTNIYNAIVKFYEYLKDLEETGELLGSVTYYGFSDPGSGTGKNGDIFLKETTSGDWEMFAKRDGTWETIAKKPV